MNFSIAHGLNLETDNPVLFAGPCVVESEEVVLEIAHTLKKLTSELNIPYVFKASFDKANRTASKSFRSLGFDYALDLLDKVRSEVGVPIVTDVHESSQVNEVAQVVDVIQIPAFLCRQTDLLQAAAKTGLTVNIKKGQFMAPEDMQYAVGKVNDGGNERVLLTERGSSFGYHNLVVDMRSIIIMREFAPVIFDVTHSVQMPGGAGGSSGGESQYALPLARAAAAVGVDGFFIETHPRPDEALSDGPNMIALKDMERTLNELMEISALSR